MQVGATLRVTSSHLLGVGLDQASASLLTMSAGLGTSVLGGHSSPEQAQAVIDYHLRRLFPGAGRGGR